MKPKDLAQKIYDEFGFNDPLEVDLNLVANNYYLIIEPVDFDGVDGFIITTKNGGIIKVNENIKDEKWSRFTIAHELGHYLYRKHNDLLENDTIVIYEDKRSNLKEERFVNEFAAELLMPEKIYKDFIENKSPNIQTFQEISERFNVSIPAAAVRYTAIGKEPIAVIFSKDGIINWRVISRKFSLNFLRLYQPIPVNSCAGYLLESNQNYALIKVSPEVWFYEDIKLSKNRNSIFYEECLRLDGGNSFLSIIKLNMDLENLSQIKH